MADDRDGKDQDERVVPLPRKDGVRRRCPTCGAATIHRYRPFCSKRCADVDLGRWLKEGYRLPTEEPADFEEGGPEGA